MSQRKNKASLRRITASSALECQVQFLSEERTEAYRVYAVGAPEEKIVHGAKKPDGQSAVLAGYMAGAEVVS